MRLHKGLVIGGTHSGCGKTTLTMGISRALKKRGMDVQPWKAGPDYIDPGFHSRAAGRICRNLDTMILSADAVQEIYQRQECEISLVEGVMGLFDGAGGLDERGSAAHLAKLLKLPVVVVIDSKAMARSAGAVALGFTEFDPDVNVAGFVMNRVGSDRHYRMLKEAIEDRTRLPVFGYLARDERLSLPERHLGLVPPWETEDFEGTLEALSLAVEETIDLDALVRTAATAGVLDNESSTVYSSSVRREQRVRIAVARDHAFHFYYEENLDLLRHFGAEIVPFSPIGDPTLPEGVSALYIGGGYPELHGRDLAENASLTAEIRRRCAEGMPVYGECGGFMYLTEGIVNAEGKLFGMLSLLPGRARMGRKLGSLGYCQVVMSSDTILGPRGSRAMGHVFHWAALEGVPDQARVFAVEKGDEVFQEGFAVGSVLGSWVHLHFASNPTMASRFVDAAEKYRFGHNSSTPK